MALLRRNVISRGEDPSFLSGFTPRLHDPQLKYKSAGNAGSSSQIQTPVTNRKTNKSPPSLGIQFKPKLEGAEKQMMNGDKNGRGLLQRRASFLQALSASRERIVSLYFCFFWGGEKGRVELLT